MGKDDLTGKKRRLTATQEAEILYDYFDNMKSAAEVAEKYQVTHVTVIDVIKRNGYTPRTKKEASQVRSERKKADVIAALAAKRGKNGQRQDRESDAGVQGGNPEVGIGQESDQSSTGVGDRDFGSQARNEQTQA